MKLFPEKIYHELFEIGITLKAIDSSIEIVLGFAFFFVSRQTISDVFFFLLGDENTDQPKNALWNYLIHASHGFSPDAQAFWAFIFLSHGIIKIFLVVGLWKEKLWAFRVSAAVFILFVLNQTYHIIYYTPSIPLELLTILDVALIYLIIHEYRYKKRLMLKRQQA